MRLPIAFRDNQQISLADSTTFSLVSRYESIRYILAHTALLDWEIEAMDVKTAFLYGELKEEIYMEQPEGFVVKGQEKKVWKLIKSI